MRISREQSVSFMKILIQMGIDKEDVIGITLMVEEAEHMKKLLDVMAEKDYEMTSREVYRAAAEVITGRTIDDLIHNSPEGIVPLEDWEE